MSIQDSAPIGVFDSGLGGLTVLRVLARQFPNENFLYVGDTARLPYGSKSAETIRQYSVQAMEHLCQAQVKAIIVACNSASTQVQELEYSNIPVLTVIEPGASRALAITQTGRIGVLGTRATILSGLYQKTLEEKAKSSGRKIDVFSQAAPLFVPLAEEGWVGDPVTNLIAYRYVAPLIAEGIDTLILGCTHYPILRESIQKAAGGQVQLVDSGEALGQRLLEWQTQGRLPIRKSTTPREIQIECTDFSPHFEAMSKQILELSEPLEFAHIQL